MLKNIDTPSLLLFNKLNIPPYYNIFNDIEILWFNATDASKTNYMMSQRSHHHSFFEVHFIIHGDISYKINTTTLNVKCGNYIIISPNQNHKICGFSKDFARLSLGFSFSASNPLYGAIIKNTHKNLTITTEIAENITYIQNQLKKETTPFMFGIQNRILEIIYSLSGKDNIKSIPSVDNADKDARISKAKQFIKDNISSHISCNDIATYCYLSVKQLNRIFLKYENKSLLKYLHEQKIKHIQNLLSNTEKSLKQISIDSGFINEYYFNSFFKKHAGQTPGDYRRSMPNKTTSQENNI